MGLEPPTSYVTGMFRFVSLLSVDVCKRPSYHALGRGAYSADVRRSMPIFAPYATLMLHLSARAKRRLQSRVVYRLGAAIAANSSARTGTLKSSAFAPCETHSLSTVIISSTLAPRLRAALI